MKDYKNTNENIRLKIKEIKEIRKTNEKLAQRMEDSLIVSLAYIVHSVVYKYKRFNNYEDLYQEGMFGLIKAVRQYNSDTSFHFTRYALWWIKARVMRSIKKMNIITISGEEDVKYFVQCDVQDNDIIDYNNPEIKAMLAQKIDIVNLAIATMPEKHQQIIKMRYGLSDTKEYNLQDLSNKLDMTREGVRQLEHRILDKLKINNIFND